MDIFSNFISIIKNGYKSKKIYVDVPKSKRLKKLIFFFIKEGFFLGIEETETKFPIFRIYLKYDGLKPVISGLIKISKTSRPINIKHSTLCRIYKPSYSIILSTHFGYQNGFQALQKGIGGQFFCIIY